MSFQTEDRHERQLLLLDYLYDIFEVGVQKRDFSMRSHLRDAGLGHNLSDEIAIFIDIGIFEREGPEYGNSENGLGVGRHYHYTLLVPKEEAHLLLAAWQEQHIEQVAKSRKQAPVTRTINRLKNEVAETTVAIVGDDPEPGLAKSVSQATLSALRDARKDESAALVEAARQYASRASTAVDSLLDTLEQSARELGITFDRSEAATLFSVEDTNVDERLETVSLVLPYIEQLETQIYNLTKQNEKLRKKAAKAYAPSNSTTTANLATVRMAVSTH